MLIRIPQTLWDLLPRGIANRAPAPARAERPRARRASNGVRTRPAQARYDAMTRSLLAAHGVRVRRWRAGMSGVAWEVRYEDGRVTRLIEAPRPRGPMSAAVFLHEIGHHAIGFNRYRPRCLEEYHAWAWAIAEMERLGLNVTDRVRARMRESLRYAVHKARRRGIRDVPPELRPYL